MTRPDDRDCSPPSGAAAQTLAPTGELDLATAPPLLRALAALRGRPCDLRLDLAGVSFVDVTTAVAIWEHLDAHRHSRWSLHITGAAPNVRRTLALVAALRAQDGHHG